MIVGVISDTHGLLRPEAVERLRGVAHIIHAGDIGRPGILEILGELAPVKAIRGNIDTDEWSAKLPETAIVDLASHRLFVIHDRYAIKDHDHTRGGASVVVSGHSHKPNVETLGGVLYLNPGSAGPRRFRLPVTLALLNLGELEPRATIVGLA